MNKLVKLSDTHYIVVDDSEIKEGDFVIVNSSKVGNRIAKLLNIYSTSHKYEFFDKDLLEDEYYEEFQYWNKGFSKKITHSTEPLEDVKFTNFFDKIKPLALSEVEEAINGYVVYKMALMELTDIDNDQFDKGVIYGFHKGFKAHQELVKDKLFTVEDIQNAIQFGKDIRSEKSNINENFGSPFIDYEDSTKETITYIQSLLPKTEWDLEFVEGKLTIL